MALRAINLAKRLSFEAISERLQSKASPLGGGLHFTGTMGTSLPAPGLRGASAFNNSKCLAARAELTQLFQSLYSL